METEKKTKIMEQKIKFEKKEILNAFKAFKKFNKKYHTAFFIEFSEKIKFSLLDVNLKCFIEYLLEADFKGKKTQILVDFDSFFKTIEKMEKDIFLKLDFEKNKIEISDFKNCFFLEFDIQKIGVSKYSDSDLDFEITKKISEIKSGMLYFKKQLKTLSVLNNVYISKDCTVSSDIDSFALSCNDVFFENIEKIEKCSENILLNNVLLKNILYVFKEEKEITFFSFKGYVKIKKENLCIYFDKDKEFVFPDFLTSLKEIKKEKEKKIRISDFNSFYEKIEKNITKAEFKDFVRFEVGKNTFKIIKEDFDGYREEFFSQNVENLDENFTYEITFRGIFLYEKIIDALKDFKNYNDCFIYFSEHRIYFVFKKENEIKMFLITRSPYYNRKIQ